MDNSKDEYEVRLGNFDFTYSIKSHRVKIKLADPEASRIMTPPLVAAAMVDLVDPIVEEMWIIIQNNAGARLDRVRIARGTPNTLAVAPAEIFIPVMMLGARIFTLVHNHTSGLASPSEADVQLTARILSAAQLVGLYMVDHVVVTVDPEEFFSIRSFKLVNWTIPPWAEN